MELNNQVALVTGASSGIGRELTFQLAAKGTKVVATARQDQYWDNLVTTCGRDFPHQVFCYPAELSRTSEIDDLIKFTTNNFERIDLLVNNAAYGLYGPVANVDLDDFQSQMEVNLIAPLYLSKRVFQLMSARSVRGVIVSMSSLAGLRPLPYSGSYCASKAALAALMRSFRLEARASGIRIVLVFPGLTRTNFRQNAVGLERVPVPLNLGDWLSVSPNRAARKIVKGIETNKDDIYISRTDIAWIWLNFFFRSQIDLLIMRYLARQIRKGQPYP